MSSDVDSDINSSVKPIKFDDESDQKDTGHKARPVSKTDDDYQLYLLVTRVTFACNGTLSLGDIPSLSSLLELEELPVDEFDRSSNNGDLSEVVVI